VSEQYHPADPETTRDPYSALADLRRSCPVSRRTAPGLPPVTLVTRYEDLRRVYRDYRAFGNIGFYPSLDLYGMIPEEQRTIIDLDPPRHTAVRRLNLLAMNPAAIDVVLPRIEMLAARFVEQMVAAGTAEIVGDLAVPLPADAIAAVLGLPTDDARRIHDWIESVFSEPAVDRSERPDSPTGDMNADFDAYLTEQIAARRRGDLTADDAIRRMVDFERDDGSRFTDEELCIHIRTLLMAGNETTTSLISNLVYRLLTVPDAQPRLRDDRALVGPFIEECLRFDAPLTQFPRRCLAPSTIAEVPIAVDDIVSLSIPSANRDETVWGDASEQFRIDRFTTDQPDHLSFGLGAHFCVGAYLARHTAAIALTALLDQTTELGLAPGFAFDKVWFFEFWRPKRLDIRLH